ncbi:sulfotransferase family 2 domain-containing protein [Sulfitobacter sp. M57]|uniref:sulfotransferase family 2 domain-containing protein n=1 Tax=unclassified Sulfitobacter TaxID=196795 RepID=UPI0023E0A7E0|nr:MULTISPECIES: sulfotransferase family 2 domain-containing protein [unclassified Sulfitobacter]MDF3415043.1 sulfotransferase family 2 domain-containing protein [Sulfitobacter sp. KE5]MDF3422524.1 sulfotransferase family 2 domain-containing protein [Sulfitobacter sp. KE43]MDF3433589.1 sulfotransferase family 2 domain-containing protein [Sulfitobacter sp. KE42]MDF3459229.1 sulfotransferase family 2 domain-containing protein [Sulfitobacter sp. S74]MDF3463128.1 sulfotransferase family 2 domain-c
MRHVILHNHLFKNAGTSVDHILRQNFPDRWVTREFPDPRPGHMPDIAGWIRDNSDAIAFSSHTIQTALPALPGVRIIPIVLLRDPVDRIASAYRFEKTQKSNSRGARLARENGFAGYVHARLNTQGDRQCRNFQTSRLAMLAPDVTGDELTRAQAAVRVIARDGVLGLVSNFDTAMQRLAGLLKPHFPAFDWQPVIINASGQNTVQSVSPDMRDVLEQANHDDLSLLRHVRAILPHAPTGTGTAQRAGIS